MRQILMFGVFSLVFGVSVATASELVPVREGEPIPQVESKRAQHIVNPMDGQPVPVGQGAELKSPARQTAHRVESLPGMVPVDESLPAQPENSNRSGSAPRVMDDFYSVGANLTLTVSVDAGILANDFDFEGDDLIITLITNTVDNGSITVYGNGNFSYTPDPGYLGYDYFDVRISDGTNTAETSRVHLEVVATDRFPVAQSESYHIASGETLQVPAEDGLLVNDFDPDGDNVAVTLITNSVDNGSLSVFGGGNFSYTPDDYFTGIDSFSYRISANGKIATTTATITVYDRNRAPYAVEDHYYVPANGTLSIASPAGLLRNDFDPDGDTISVSVITNGVDFGSLSVYTGGNFNYTPNASYSGLDSFSYRMRDANGSTAQTTVSIFVGVTEDPLSAVLPPADLSQFGMSLPTPNPFNPTTKIDFRIDSSARTSVRVFDVRGSLVRTLINEDLPVGAHTVHWDGRDDRGSAMASGTYFAALSSGTKQASQKLILVK